MDRPLLSLNRMFGGLVLYLELRREGSLKRGICNFILYHQRPYAAHRKGVY